jgi:hypothetical protein
VCFRTGVDRIHANGRFCNNQVVTVEATGTGDDYEYQCDGPFKTAQHLWSYVWIHIITVRDKKRDVVQQRQKHCGELISKYFNLRWWNIKHKRSIRTRCRINYFWPLLKIIKTNKTIRNWLGRNDNKAKWWYSTTIGLLFKNGEAKNLNHFALKR